MDQNQSSPSGDEGARERAVRKHWFQGLTGEQQDGIIRPQFEKAHPTNTDVRKAAENYRNNKTGQK